jgi:hypothetical protein
MQKIIYIHFKKFIVKHHGYDFWVDSSNDYAHMKLDELDADVFVGVINKAVKKLDISFEELLFKFGSYTSATLIARYGNNLQPGWRTLDTLENLNIIIQQILSKFNEAISPPRIIIQRKSGTQVELVYKSHEVFPHLGRGFIEGIATYFNEKEQTRLNMNMRMNGTTTFKVTQKKVSLF